MKQTYSYLIHFNPNHDPKTGKFTSDPNAIYRRRAVAAAKTKTQVDAVYKSLSKEDKRLIGDNKNKKEWLTLDEGEYLVKRFIQKNGDKPVAFLDILITTKKGHLTVALATDPEYRGKGYAASLAEKGKDWFDKNADKYGFDTLGWGAYADNKASTHVAEKTGFKYNKEKSTDKWSVYDYKI